MLTDKLSQIVTGVQVVGCGRTDTGVHAAAFFAHFDSDKALDEFRFVHGLNNMLPKDISVAALIEVGNKAHARFDATSRTYKYRIHAKKDPFSENYSMRFAHNLNIIAMNECGQLLLDEHNFSCFEKSGGDNSTSLCTVTEASWAEVENGCVFTITANRFLRNMVRAIVGTLLEVGQENMSKQEFLKVLESGNRSEAGKSVEARGLHLVNVEYPYIS